MKRFKLFSSTKELETLVTQYFIDAKGVYQTKYPRTKNAEGKRVAHKQVVCIREPRAPTRAGLALHLGFHSADELEICEKLRRYANPIKWAKLCLQEIFEIQLQTHHYGGAVQALKTLNGNESTDTKALDKSTDKTFKIEVLQSGPQLAASEKEVVFD